MMKIYLYLICFILCHGLSKTVQPYFPPQIVFSFDDGQTIVAVDEINQRAYQSFTIRNPATVTTAYVMKDFPYAPPDSPQSKYYVQLSIERPTNTCRYETFWKDCTIGFNLFPSHWSLDKTSYEIKNYMNFNYEMIHSNGSSQDEDYWHANVRCQVDGTAQPPCVEIYFKKNTDIPVRLTQVKRQGFGVIQVTTNFKIISIGKPDDKYFDTIPKNWYTDCQNLNLVLTYSPEATTIRLHESAKIEFSLAAPPNPINGNDTVRIQWNTTQCIDCFTISPKELYFNGKNFQEKQILTITRVKDALQTILVPIFNGGGFDIVPPEWFPLYIN